MSSSSSSPTAPASSSSSVSGNDQQRGGTSSNLYLVTFLATLFLLLFVSCAIVLRSYILRRRYQRRLDEAMAAGMLLAPRTQGSKRKRFGTKPTLFDTCLAEGGVTWEHIKPLSAQPVFVKRKYKDGRVPKDGVIISGPEPLGGNINNVELESSPDILQSEDPDRRPFLSRLRDIWGPSLEPRSVVNARRRRLYELRRLHGIDLSAEIDGESLEPEGIPPSPIAQASPQTNTNTNTAATPLTYKVRVEMLQVSVLIAMPSQTRTIRKNNALDRIGTSGIETEDDDDDDDEESPLPELVFGVTRVNYRQPKAGNTATDLPDATAQQKQAMPTVPEEEL